MKTKLTPDIQAIMDARFGCDRLIAVATVDGETPYVRAVNAYYEDGCFYIVTYALSNKMLQLEKNPRAAICGEWFTAHGVGESMGHVLLPEHAGIMDKLRTVFAEWYSNGHVNEQDENTCLMRIRLTDGVLFDHGTRYDIDFTE